MFYVTYNNKFGRTFLTRVEGQEKFLTIESMAYSFGEWWPRRHGTVTPNR